MAKQLLSEEQIPQDETIQVRDKAGKVHDYKKSLLDKLNAAEYPHGLTVVKMKKQKQE